MQVLCNHCKIPIAGNENLISADLLDRILSVTANDLDAYYDIYLKGEGCPHCNYQGYVGRTVIAEVISFIPEILGIYGNSKNIVDVRTKWLDFGGITYRHVAMQRLFVGLISPQEYEKNCGDLGVI